MKELIFSFIKPFVTAIAFLIYKDIWGLKEHLMTSTKRNKLFKLAYGRYFMDRGSFVGLNSKFEGTPCFPHGIQGIFISDKATLGNDCIIFQQVTIGSNGLEDSKSKGSPTLGNNVYIGAGAKIIGNVKIGDNCRIGANAVIHKDMPDNSVAVVGETRIIQKESLDNTYYTTVNNQEYYFKNGSFAKRERKMQ